MIEAYYAIRNMSSEDFMLKLGDGEIIPEVDGLSVEITCVAKSTMGNELMFDY